MDQGGPPAASPWTQLGGQVWHCAGCGEGLGVIVGPMLIVGVAVALEESVRVRCMVCGRHQRWHAGRQPAARSGQSERPSTLKTIG